MKFSHNMRKFLDPQTNYCLFWLSKFSFRTPYENKKRGLWILNGLCETNFAHPAPACTLSEIQNGVCEFILKFPPSPNSPIFPPFHKHPPIANLFATLRPLHSVTLSLTHSKPPCKPTPPSHLTSLSISISHSTLPFEHELEAYLFFHMTRTRGTLAAPSPSCTPRQRASSARVPHDSPPQEATTEAPYIPHSEGGEPTSPSSSTP